MEDIILLGDFTTQTKDEQTTMLDANKVVYGEITAEVFGLKRNE